MTTFSEMANGANGEEIIGLRQKARMHFFDSQTPEEMAKEDTKQVREALSSDENINMTASFASNQQKQDSYKRSTDILFQWCDIRGLRP